MKLSKYLIKEKNAHPPRVSHNPNKDKITHVPARVNHNPILSARKTDRRPRVNHSPNTKKIVHVPARGESMCERKPAKM